MNYDSCVCSTLLFIGLIDLGLEHLSNAIVLCGQAEQLLAIFQQTLSEQQYALLIEKLPQANEVYSVMNNCQLSFIRF